VSKWDWPKDNESIMRAIREDYYPAVSEYINKQQSQLRLLAEAVLMVDGQRDWETLLLTEDEREAFESACVLAKEIMGVSDAVRVD